MTREDALALAQEKWGDDGMAEIWFGMPTVGVRADPDAPHGTSEYFGHYVTDRSWETACRRAGLLDGRTARCMCGDVRPSSDPTLPFFQARPNEDTDAFYCGCHGWD